ncbi:hypothetical protein D9M69_686990 [compost metagenome]
MRDGADPIHHQAGQGEQGDHQGDLERQLHADHVEPDEHRVEGDPPERLKLAGCLEDAAHVAADEEHDHRRGEHVLHVLRQAGEEAAPRTHGAAGEGIGAAGMWQGG